MISRDIRTSRYGAHICNITYPLPSEAFPHFLQPFVPSMLFLSLQKSCMQFEGCEPRVDTTAVILLCSLFLFWLFLTFSLCFYGTIYHNTEVLLQNARCYFRNYRCLCRSRTVFPHMHHFTVIHNEFQLLHYCSATQSCQTLL